MISADYFRNAVDCLATAAADMPSVLALVREWREMGTSFGHGIYQGQRAILEEDPPFAGDLVTIAQEFVGQRKNT